MWTWFREAWSLLAKFCLPHSIPPLADEVECSLFALSLSVLCQVLSSHDARAAAAALSYIHSCRGLRWQLLPLYLALFLILVLDSTGVIVRVFSGVLLLLSALLSFVVPAVPPIQPFFRSSSALPPSTLTPADSSVPPPPSSVGSPHYQVGVQDIVLNSKSTKDLDGHVFIFRCFYPCDKDNADLRKRSTLSALLQDPHAVALLLLIEGLFILSKYRGPENQFMYNLAAISLLPVAAQYLLQHFSQGFTTPYFPEGAEPIKGVSDYSKLPLFLFSHMNQMTIHCAEDAPVSPSCKRIALFLPGLGGVRTSYSASCVQLASEGFFVAVLESSDGTPCSTTLPDGTVKKYKPYKPPVEGQVDHAAEHAFRNGQLQHRSKELTAIMEFLVDKKHSEGMKLSYAYDQPASVRDALVGLVPGLSKSHSYTSSIDQSSFWRSFCNHRFEVSTPAGASKIIHPPILVGHSFGGATVLHMGICETDITCREFRQRWGVGAVVAFDPWCHPLSPYCKTLDETTAANPAAKVASPVLVMHADLFQWAENMEVERSVVRGCAHVVHLRIRNAGHFDYTEMGLLSPPISSQLLRKTGKQDPVVLQTHINRIVSTFIRCVLQHESLQQQQQQQQQQHQQQHQPAASGNREGSGRDGARSPGEAQGKVPIDLYKSVEVAQRVKGVEILEARW